MHSLTKDVWATGFDLLLETLRLTFFLVSRKPRTAKSHVTIILPSVRGLRFAFLLQEDVLEVCDLRQHFYTIKIV